MTGLQWLLSEGGFSTMSFCLAGDPFSLTWLAFANGAVAVSYAAIWLQLAVCFFRLGRGQALAFAGRSWVIVLFGAFILACGVGHAIMLVNMVHAFFRLEAAWMLLTAALSVTTAVMMSFMVHFQPDDRSPDDGKS